MDVASIILICVFLAPVAISIIIPILFFVFNVFNLDWDWIEDLWDNMVEFWLVWLGAFFIIAGLILTILGGIAFDNVIKLTFNAKICFVVFGPILIILGPILIWSHFAFFGWYEYHEVKNLKNYETKKEENVNQPKKTSKSKKLNLTKEKMKEFDNFFDNKLIGQDEATKHIKQQLVQILYELDEERTRPAGVFFFVGPTGVGKTEMCKTLSEFLYNNKELNRFDMSEYKSEMAIQQLIGAPNGYVGYDEGGTLINKMKKNPNSIVLFDEIEKADKNVFDLFLQMLDEGIVTSNKGEKIRFKNNIIVFTSNIGANLIKPNMSREKVKEVIREAVNDFFSYTLNRPEILGRIGKENIISFNMISDFKDLSKILDIHFNKFIKELNMKKVNITFNKENVYKQILIGVDVTKGARDIRNEFDQFKKHFMHALFDNNYDYENLKDKTLDFDYDHKKVLINNVVTKGVNNV